MGQLLTVEQVCERLVVSRWTVYRLIKERQVESVLVGRCRRITAASLNDYITDLVEDAA